METLTVLDLFSGIGGFSLGLERTGGFKTIAFCEIDPFCRKVLAKHWPDVPCRDDIRAFTPQFRPDVICGGFPCQPFSHASHGRKVAVDLWPEMRRVVASARPALVIAENVQEAPIASASRDLSDLGYSVTYRRISAEQLGAPHTRSRWWAIAHTHHEGELHRALDAEVAKLPGIYESVWSWSNHAESLRVPNGLPHRVDRLRALGNSVVPQIPELIGRAILSARAAA